MKYFALIMVLFIAQTTDCYLYYLSIFKTPSNKLLYLLGDFHNPEPMDQSLLQKLASGEIDPNAEGFDEAKFIKENSNVTQLRLLMKYFKQAEAEGTTCQIFLEKPNAEVILEKGHPSILCNFTEQFEKENFQNVQLEDVEIRKFSQAWHAIFCPEEDQSLDGFVEERFYLRGYLNGTIKNILDNHYLQTYGKSFVQAQKELNECDLLEITMQDVYDEFDTHKRKIYQLRDSMTNSDLKEIFTKAIEEAEAKIAQYLEIIKMNITPETKLLDFVINIQKEGLRKNYFNYLYCAGRDILSAYFDLYSCYKILLMDETTFDKTIFLAGGAHCEFMSRFLVQKAKHMGFEEIEFRIKAHPTGEWWAPLPEKYLSYVDSSIDWIKWLNYIRTYIPAI